MYHKKLEKVKVTGHCKICIAVSSLISKWINRRGFPITQGKKMLVFQGRFFCYCVEVVKQGHIGTMFSSSSIQEKKCNSDYFKLNLVTYFLILDQDGVLFLKTCHLFFFFNRILSTFNLHFAFCWFLFFSFNNLQLY